MKHHLRHLVRQCSISGVYRTLSGSDKIEEAYNYLVSSFTEIKNYKAALSALDEISSKDSRLESAYQRVAF